MGNNDSQGKCPYIGGTLKQNAGTGTSNRDWWPNMLLNNYNLFPRTKIEKNLAITHKMILVNFFYS
jgi:hypothetical protein